MTCASASITVSLAIGAIALGTTTAAFQQNVSRVGGDVSAPVVVSDAMPMIPTDPLRVPVTGTVVLEAVIGIDGAVHDIKLTTSVEPAIDQQVVRALRDWSFKPAIKDGAAVPVLVTFQCTLGSTGGQTLHSPDVAYRPGKNVTSPVVLREVKPEYTTAARDAKTAGHVWLSCAVMPDGTVSDVRVIRGLDRILDQKAIEALRQWRFAPGRRDGVPVRVDVDVEMAFTLK
jgi:TonB family protein